jgi:hypothetical protein
MECSIIFANDTYNLCCICLDECLLDEKNKKSKTNEYVNFKCCNGIIHKRCLLMMFLNDFEHCCLCRREISVVEYYTIQDIKNLLHINEMKIYKKELYKILYELSAYKILCYIYIFFLNIKLFLYKIKNFIYTSILDLKLSIKEIFSV